MTTVTPTVLDVARTVARLDEYAAIGEHDLVDINGHQWSRFELRWAVATEFAYQLGRQGWGTGRHVTTRDIRMMLVAAGASSFTIERHARAIASLVRADYSEGRP